MNRGKCSKCSLRDLFFSWDRILEIVTPKSTESWYNDAIVILGYSSKERLYASCCNHYHGHFLQIEWEYISSSYIGDIQIDPMHSRLHFLAQYASR